MATVEELLAQAERESAVATGMDFLPTPTPTPSIMATPSFTPTPEPLVGTMFGTYKYPSEINNQFSLENVRIIPEEAASIAGSIIGGRVGTIIGRAGGSAFGPLGSILGGALGSFADVPIQKAIDYFAGVTPSEGRVEQATKEAALGAGIEGTLKLAGPVGRIAGKGVSKIATSLADYLGPQTEEAAQRLVGKEISRIASPGELLEAAQTKEALTKVLPAQNLTTAELTGIDELAQAERLLKTQPAGDANIKFAATAKQKLDDINQSALQLTDLGDPNPKRAGEAARSLLQGAEERQRKAASELFTEEVKSIPVPVKGLAKEAKKSFIRFFPESDINTADNELWNLYEKLIEETAPKGKLKKGEAITTTVGRLQELRSAILDVGRRAQDGTRDESFANSLSEIIAKQIDAVEGTESLSTARAAWREYKQRWFFDESGQRAPLNKVLRKQSPEDIIAEVSKKSAVSDEYAKVLGGLEPNKLATEMADFANKETVDEKLKWIRDKRAIYVDSPIWPLVQGWEDILKRTQTAAKSADVPALSPSNIDVQAKSLIRALGGESRVLPSSPADAVTISALGNVARSGITSTLGGKISGALSAAALRFGLPTAQRGTELVATALTQALQDPATAYKYVADAAKFGEEAAAQTAMRGQKFLDSLASIAPQTAALARGAGFFTPQMQEEVSTPLIPSITETPVPSGLNDAQRKELEDLLKLAEAPTEPTPTPEPIQVGKQNISIPTGDAYAPPSLVKAVMQVESGGNQEAVSPKGARGLMQLMPVTAKQLGINAKDPQENVEGGSRYLQQQLDRFGNRELALAAYNWGPENVQRAIDKIKADGKKPTWALVKAYVKVPKETREYVDRVLNII